MFKIIKYAVAAVVVIAAAVILYFAFRKPEESVTVGRGEISRIESMVQLCSVDIYSEVPVLDTINSKVIFAIQKQRGSISFDLSKLLADTASDTIRLSLPPEIIELYEDTQKNSWEVVDTKAIGSMAFLRSDKFSIEEENAVKAKIKQKSVRLLYRNRTVERARREAAENLRILMEKAYRKPVVVTDSTPLGVHYNQFR